MSSRNLPDDIDKALEEAVWLGIKVQPERKRVGVALDVLTLPEIGDGRRMWVVLWLEGVRRIAASYRLGRWDDPSAEVVGVSLAELPEVLASFGRRPVYGWEFFDPSGAGRGGWATSGRQLSLDVRWARGPSAHVIELFQESDRQLDVRVWFDTVRVVSEGPTDIPLDVFAAAGERWWSALFAGDERTEHAGIHPITAAEVWRLEDGGT